MKVVVDTNIVFSAILNTQGKIAQILIEGSPYFQFYSVSLLKEELATHRNKLLQISGYSISQFEEIRHSVISKIHFIDDVFISDRQLKIAWELTKNIDENDTLFVALTSELKSHLWTGDKKLIQGLQAKGYNKLFTTQDIYQKFLECKLRKNR